MAKMPLFLAPLAVTSLLIFLFGTLLLFKKKEKTANRCFSAICFSASAWLAARSFYHIYSNEGLLRLGYAAITFMPVLLLHFVSVFIELPLLRRKHKTFYLVGAVFSLLILFTKAVIEGVIDSSGGYSLLAGYFFPLYCAFFIITLGLSVSFLVSALISGRFTGRKKIQAKYILISCIFFFLTTFVFIPGKDTGGLTYDLVLLYVSIIILAYAIIKLRLADLGFLVIRALIFIGVYAFIIGIPFLLGSRFRQRLIQAAGDNWWIIPIILSTLLANAGQYVYFFIKKRAEARILQEQQRYQNTLRRASLGMGRIRELKRLLKLIVHIVTRTVRIESCSIYLFHEASGQFTLRAVKGSSEDTGYGILSIDSPIVKYVLRVKEPVVYEEIREKRERYSSDDLLALESQMRFMDAEVAVPSFIEERLIAIIMLGKKNSGGIYTRDDIVVFSILANQSALAIENTRFYEEAKRTHEQLIKAEKMATIGTLADGLSHQINNRLHALGFIAGDILDSIRLRKKGMLPPENEARLFDDIENALGRINENVKHGGEIVEGLLKYTRKGPDGLAPIDINELFNSSLEMAMFKIKPNEMKIISNIGDNAPKVMGNFAQLQEVFFNMIDNSYDAVIQRKAEFREEDYRGFFEFTVQRKGKNIEINAVDNGIGVKTEDMRKVFTPFFSTKSSSNKGTGLGMYVIRQIIEDNHRGKVSFESQYKIGSRVIICLPVAEG
ncbi:MAG: GAF domain-containing protein [Candidatus Omnitrophica bacterium]|nr:GAF domain-containing protein [Candidatus Omnitrophota bacterium]